MAKAEVKIKHIDEISLTLNQNELKFLLTVLGRIGGCPTNSPRQYADSIMEALSEELEANGFAVCTLDFSSRLCEDNRTIYFKDF